jgi:glutamyl-tRNA synthetase
VWPSLIDADDRLVRIAALFKDRCETLVDLANWAKVFYVDSVERNAEDYAKHVTEAANPVLDAFAAVVETWNGPRKPLRLRSRSAQGAGREDAVLAMPVRVLTVGTAHTPSVDAVLELLGREKVIARLKNR